VVRQQLASLAHVVDLDAQHPSRAPPGYLEARLSAPAAQVEHRPSSQVHGLRQPREEALRRRDALPEVLLVVHSAGRHDLAVGHETKERSCH
jgi:hypothetical protein